MSHALYHLEAATAFGAPLAVGESVIQIDTWSPNTSYI